MIVLVLAAGLAAYALGNRWAPLGRQEGLAAVGTLEAVELSVASEVTGRVVEVLVDEGDAVQVGQPLVRLDTSVLDLQYRLADPAQRQLLGLQIEKHTLRAPGDGRVLQRAVQPGDVAVPGARLLTIADTTKLDLTVYVLQQDIGRVSVGAPVALEAEALPGEAFSAEVASIASRAEFTPRNTQTRKDRLNLVFAVKIRLTASDERLKPGMAVTARFGS